MNETGAFLEALEELDGALDRSVELHGRMKERLSQLRTWISEGRNLTEVVPAEDPPLLVQLLTETAGLLHTYGNTVRRTEARALRQQGMTMDQIARLFGVTRQRVSTLLRDSEQAEAGS